MTKLKSSLTFQNDFLSGNLTFEIGPIKEILRKINIASSFDDNDGYSMEGGFGDDDGGYSLEEGKCLLLLFKVKTTT